MEMLQGRLISKIDEVLAQIASEDLPPNTQLQIEANLVHPHDSGSLSRRIVLDSIDIDDLKHQITSTDGASHSGQKHANRALEDLSLNTAIDTIATSGPGGHSMVERTPLTVPPVRDGRRLVGDDRAFSKRLKRQHGHDHKLEALAIDKLIENVWEQIYNLKNLALGNDLEETQRWVLEKSSDEPGPFASTNLEFIQATKRCRQITTSSRTARALEVVVQAHWIDCYDTRLAALNKARPDLRLQEHKKTVLTEACSAFSWSEKELRNRMAVWKGYRELKNAAGWAAIVFAGPGIYRFCKYRLGFDEDAVNKLRCLRLRTELAADTLQPQWRQLLALVGESTGIQWQGHPHDWTVSIKKGELPLALAETYKQWDANFTYQNLDDSIVDIDKWGQVDPRRFEDGPDFHCKSCLQRQSSSLEDNECNCFPDLYSPKLRTLTPVQVFRTANGKNNGLIACLPFAQGQAIGEFIGSITRGLADVDVMASQAGTNEPYQIWQGRCGNFTRFMNHSCASNCQFQTFSWLGVQRIVVVSKGVAAGDEITVDYSGRYWDNLDKICLCGEACCRYRERRVASI